MFADDIALYCTISAAADYIIYSNMTSLLLIIGFKTTSFLLIWENVVQCLYLVGLCILILHLLCFLQLPPLLSLDLTLEYAF